MPLLIIQNLNALKINIVQKELSLLKNIQENSIDWMHACGANGRCTTCRFIVEKGGEHLNPPNETERNFMEKGKLKHNERLACQCTISEGEVEISVPEPCKLPHMEYST